MKNQTVLVKKASTSSFAKSIRAKCLDCSGGSPCEVRDCPLVNCPLWEVRFGMSAKSAAYQLAKNYTVKLVE
ncbi:hypothetical protein [Megasphaera sp.]|uniref:hypothetical protein n=1 Tax=Megasphaera sp. TaxID=2023260 RepID=UPI0025C2E4B1|nr:hypothetical protein [Megasphaera sp.]